MIRCITIKVTHLLKNKRKNLLLCLWVCGQKVIECGQAVGNALALSMAGPYVPLGR